MPSKTSTPSYARSSRPEATSRPRSLRRSSSGWHSATSRRVGVGLLTTGSRRRTHSPSSTRIVSFNRPRESQPRLEHGNPVTPVASLSSKSQVHLGQLEAQHGKRYQYGFFDSYPNQTGTLYSARGSRALRLIAVYALLQYLFD